MLGMNFGVFHRSMRQQYQEVDGTIRRPAAAPEMVVKGHGDGKSVDSGVGGGLAASWGRPANSC